MTDTQLYLAIGAPMLFNALLITLLVLNQNARFASIERYMDARFTSLEKIWDEKLARVEGVTDARLKHLEER